MRVRCLRIVNPVTRELEDRNASIKVGEEYVVLEVVASPGRYVRLRLHLAPGVPSLWDSEMFETVDRSIPSNWGVRVSGEGFVATGPMRWLVDGFWEGYFDDEPSAVSLFQDELAITLAES
jgi:hypothetical protein